MLLKKVPSKNNNLRPDSFDFSGNEGGAFPEFLNQKALVLPSNGSFIIAHQLLSREDLFNCFNNKHPLFQPCAVSYSLSLVCNNYCVGWNRRVLFSSPKNDGVQQILGVVLKIGDNEFILWNSSITLLLSKQ